MMNQVKGGYKEILKDDKGRHVEVFVYWDNVFPALYPELFDPVEHLKSIKNFPYRQTDVLQCAYPKSGMFIKYACLVQISFII